MGSTSFGIDVLRASTRRPMDGASSTRTWWAHPARLPVRGLIVAGAGTGRAPSSRADPRGAAYSVAGDHYRSTGRAPADVPISAPMRRDPGGDGRGHPDPRLRTGTGAGVRRGRAERALPARAPGGGHCGTRRAFPRSALVSGSFERDQAEAARRWAKASSGRPWPSPCGWTRSAWWSASAPVTPVTRAQPQIPGPAGPLEGEALVRGVDQLYLAEPGAREATLLGIFGRAEAEPWFARKLREHAAPGDPGARRLLGAYLDALHDYGLAWRSSPPVDTRRPVLATRCVRHGPRRARPPPARGAGAGSGGSRWRSESSAARLHAAFLAAEAQAGRRERGRRPGRRAGSRSWRGSPRRESWTRASASGCAPWPWRRARPTSSARSPQASISVGTMRRAVASLLARGGLTLTDDAWDWIEPGGGSEDVRLPRRAGRIRAGGRGSGGASPGPPGEPGALPVCESGVQGDDQGADVAAAPCPATGTGERVRVTGSRTVIKCRRHARPQRSSPDGAAPLHAPADPQVCRLSSSPGCLSSGADHGLISH